MPKIRLAAGLCPDRLGSLRAPPNKHPSHNGDLLLRERDGGEGKGREGALRGREFPQKSR